MSLSTTELLLLSWLKGPVHGRLRCLSGMCTDEAPYTEIDRKVLELDDLVCGMTDAMQEAVGGA